MPGPPPSARPFWLEGRSTLAIFSQRHLLAAKKEEKTMRNLAAIGVVAGLAASAAGQTFVYERAVQGPTGIISGGGLAVSDVFFCGWRFEVTGGPIQTTTIGGHFFSGGGDVFGAIVRLSGPNDDPDDFTLNSPDVLGRTLVTLPAGSSNVAQGPLPLTLGDGWYLVVFGSGSFGATGSAPLVAQDPGTAVPGVQNNITYRQPSHPLGQAVFVQGSVARVFVEYTRGSACYPNCDESTVAPVLNVQDFTCFLQRYAAGDSYANCDNSTIAPVLNVQDFTCFLQSYAAGCP
jgi:hypothetical protein